MSSGSIFIIEDEAIVAEDIRSTLQKLGYTVAGVSSSGENALETLKTVAVDLVLMDIHLSGKIDGIDTAAILEKEYKMPIIYLTAFSDDTVLNRAKLTQPYGYIIKPFLERELHSSIEMALYRYQMEQKLDRSAHTIRALANAIPDAIMLIDVNKNILAINNQMAIRLNTIPEMIIDHPILEFNKDRFLTVVLQNLDKIDKDPFFARFQQKEDERWSEIYLFSINDPLFPERTVVVQFHDITEYKELELQLEKEGFGRIERNIEEFMILNDKIRNPLQAITGYLDLDGGAYKSKIIEQIKLINSIIDRLDQGLLESEKVRDFLLRHYHHGEVIDMNKKLK